MSLPSRNPHFDGLAFMNKLTLVFCICSFIACGQDAVHSSTLTVSGGGLPYADGAFAPQKVAFEEGTSAAWLYDLLKPHVAQVIVCDPRKNALLKTGNKNDRVDARKLSDLLHAGLLTPVYHGESRPQPCGLRLGQ